MIVKINPHTISKTFSVVEITLPMFSFESPLVANVYFVLPDEKRRFPCECKNKSVVIPNDIYSQWGTDDQYIINYVLGKLGLTPADTEPE